jgi:tetratricopeptide (TPR) repeat protein
VQYLLTGRVRWQEAAAGRAAQVRVSPELIRTDDGTTAWEQSFDADPSDAFAVQRRIAGEVSRALNLALTPKDSSSAGERPTGNAAAYDAYLQGEQLLQRADLIDGDARPAVAQLERAVTLDPAFGLGYARLSYAHLLLYWIFNDRSAERLAQGSAAAERARVLAPDLPATHLALSYVRYWGHRDYAGARLELDQGLRARPNDVKLLQATAWVARRSGRWDEAISMMRRMVELDPRNPVAFTDLASTAARALGPGEAEPLYERSAVLAAGQWQLWQDWMAIRMVEGNEARVREIIHRAETGLGEQFPAWFLTNDHYGAHQLLANLAEPELRARLLATPRVSELASDSAQTLLMKSALATAAGDKGTAHRFAEESGSIFGRLAVRDTAEATWRSGMARAALLAGRSEDAIRQARRAVEILPSSLDHLDGPNHLLLLAEAHAAAGHADSALAHLKVLLTLPSFWKPGAVFLMPTFAALRNDPRFVKLLESAPK